MTRELRLAEAFLRESKHKITVNKTTMFQMNMHALRPAEACLCESKPEITDNKSTMFQMNMHVLRLVEACLCDSKRKITVNKSTRFHMNWLHHYGYRVYIDIYIYTHMNLCGGLNANSPTPNLRYKTTLIERLHSYSRIIIFISF